MHIDQNSLNEVNERTELTSKTSTPTQHLILSAAV